MTKSTRRALLSSVVALVICVTMLIGTTFAWFTDTASTAVNTIVSGTLDVKLLDKEGNPIEGKTLDFVKADGAPADEAILWEPGCEYNLETVVIKNDGNLALKYTVVVSGINGDAKLNEAIDWTIKDVKDEPVTTSDEDGTNVETVKFLLPNETATLTISGHMKEDAGNEYQGLTIEGAAITVYATQYTYEWDSTTDQYDKDATLPSTWGGKETEELTQDEYGVYHITNAAQFVDYLNSIHTNDGKEYYNVVLDCDIDFAGRTIEVSGTSAAFSGTFDGQNHTVSNYTIKRDDTCTYTGLFSISSWSQDGRTTTFKNLTVKNGTVISNGAQVAAILPNVENGATLENCHAIDCTVIGEKKVGAVAGYNREATVSNCSAENCNVYCTDSRAEQVSVYGYDNNGTFTDNAEPVNCNVASGVTAVSNAEELAAALNVDRKGDVGTIILTSDITVENWTPAHANYASFVLDGNGHSISGLTDALISAIGPSCEVTIKNLTIKNPSISDARTEGTKATVGAIIRCINGEGGDVNLTIDNCHINGGSIYGWKYAGGFIGMVGGTATTNNIVIKNSTIKNVDISTTDSSAGGFVAHTHSDVTFENCSVLGNTTIKCAEERNGSDAKAGALIGTVNANTTTITNCTVDSTVTVTNVNAIPVNNGMVGRNYGIVNAD